MARSPTLTPRHSLVKKYYATLQDLRSQDVEHELGLRRAFEVLLAESARLRRWTLVGELSTESRGRTVVPDGTIRDRNYLPRGYWEAKDTRDDLEAEIRKKIERGYPTTNIIFEDTRRAILYQDKREALRADLTEPDQLCELVNQFHQHVELEIDTFEKAVEEFKERVPNLGRGLKEVIEQAHGDNPAFQSAFDEFFELCHKALNPNLSEAAVDEMLIQHLLTERLFRTVFQDSDFTRRNVIAGQVEKVIEALVSQSFSRDEFLRSLDRFYVAIEEAARNLPDFSDKQHFLNTVYERFFQGYSVKVADTHGIVYTPQPIVDFMCASVAEVLQSEFGLSLSSPEVVILDPCTGTGNFIVNLMRRIPKRDLPRMYREQLFANEVMLLPYYIASLNIEHAYYELTGKYEPFDGLCFVDTLDLAEGQQIEMFGEENTLRVEREKETKITVIIGNPPYNMHQQNENDNNKNRQYKMVDSRVSETYAKDSNASNVNKLVDPYVKFFRWASDRIDSSSGVVCFVSNNGFLDQISFDGMRKHLLADFHKIFHVDLRGNVRKNPERAGSTYNVFGIRVGVGVTVAIKQQSSRGTKLSYHPLPLWLRREEKLFELSRMGSIRDVEWVQLVADERQTWLVPEHADQYSRFVAIAGDKANHKRAEEAALFRSYSLGATTNRDIWTYDFSDNQLRKKITIFIDTYNSEVDRWKRRTDRAVSLDKFVVYDDRKIKWSRDLKLDLKRERYAEFSESKILKALYRPFDKRFLFYDPVCNEEPRHFEQIFPNETLPKAFLNSASEEENRIVALTDAGSEKPFMITVSSLVPDMHVVGAGASCQCFPFYTYNEDGTNRRENITDWALEKFRAQYSDTSISKWDIFYYVYGVLHHPGYREKFADNLKRELPRIPFAPDFRRFAEAGRELARLHLDYENLEPHPLEFIENPDLPLSSSRIQTCRFRIASKTRCG